MRFLLTTTLAVLVAGGLRAAEPTTDEERFSYLFAYANVGTQIKQMVDDLGLDQELLMAGIRDALADKDPIVPLDEQQKLYDAMRQKQQAAEASKGADNMAKGKAFLEEIGQKEGVVILPSGMAYEVITEGSGAKPAATDKVKVHYRGTLIDGTEFDSSYSRGTPAEFPLNGVIKGWTEGLQLMKTGGKWKLYIPADMAYGESGSGAKIGPNETLVFEVELLEILGEE
jgi:FKBP-type peptidyl-prolyl cis-trans isomerase